MTLYTHTATHFVTDVIGLELNLNLHGPDTPQRNLQSPTVYPMQHLRFFKAELCTFRTQISFTVFQCVYEQSI